MKFIDLSFSRLCTKRTLKLPTILKGFGIDTTDLEESLKDTESEEQSMVDDKRAKILEMTIAELDLSVRSYNCLSPMFSSY